ncbi:hypothetical protein Pyn_04053 [Prunus yedoensis var. nudiflora]|uniref:Uncharacterized protein n=1 Tax=Prunus yedoensis var. nudiflora TaxID=2094558 RepID=A0A314YM01_PRUYE|nr:hypothetical protein Pyn_04053 [Prunus yedoensis var. nudiflora]
MGSEPSLSSKTGKAMENVVPMGSKIWTKSKSAKDTSRQVLMIFLIKLGPASLFWLQRIRYLGSLLELF